MKITNAQTYPLLESHTRKHCASILACGSNAQMFCPISHSAYAFRSDSCISTEEAFQGKNIDLHSFLSPNKQPVGAKKNKEIELAQLCN